VLPAKSRISTALKLSAVKIKAGHERAERLSVHVVPKAGGTSDGKVTIKAGSIKLCAVRLAKAKGSCRLSAKELRPGTYHLTAAYRGSGRQFAASISPKKTLTVTH